MQKKGWSSRFHHLWDSIGKSQPPAFLRISLLAMNMTESLVMPEIDSLRGGYYDWRSWGQQDEFFYS